MVWPILISVDVTPRISAAVKAAGQTGSASAPSTTNFGIERIDTLPVLFGAQPGPRSPGQLNMPGARKGSETPEMAAAKMRNRALALQRLPETDHGITPAAAAPARHP